MLISWNHSNVPLPTSHLKLGDDQVVLEVLPRVTPACYNVIMPGYCLQSPMHGSPLACPAPNINMTCRAECLTQIRTMGTSPWQRKQKMLTGLAWVFCVPHPRVIIWWPQATDARGESQCQCPGEAGQHSHKLWVSHNLTHRISHHIVTGRMEHPPAVRLTYNLDKAKYV